MHLGLGIGVGEILISSLRLGLDIGMGVRTDANSVANMFFSYCLNIFLYSSLFLSLATFLNSSDVKFNKTDIILSQK